MTYKLKDHPCTAELQSFSYCRANCMDMNVGTNCPMGGDAGHGGITVIELIDTGGTDYEVEMLTDISGENSHVSGVRLVFSGDSEAQVIAEALLDAGYTLLKQLDRNKYAREI